MKRVRHVPLRLGRRRLAIIGMLVWRTAHQEFSVGPTLRFSRGARSLELSQDDTRAVGCKLVRRSDQKFAPTMTAFRAAPGLRLPVGRRPTLPTQFKRTVRA